MFYDLNVPVTPGSEGSKAALLALAAQLGYDAVALNHVVFGSVGSKPCALKAVELPGDTGQPVVQNSLFRPSGAHSDEPGSAAKRRRVPSTLRQYTRITVVIDEMIAAYALAVTNSVLLSYDLVAVQPESRNAWDHLCEKGSDAVDIVTLDMSKRLPFKVTEKQVKQALAKGITFEICYSAGLRDGLARRYFFSNSLHLVAVTGGRGVILSSGAEAACSLRGPYDVLNLGSLFGLSQEMAKRCLSSNGRAVLARAEARAGCNKADSISI
jgi:ribonuclease P/MRP protein subunit RPP1